MTQTTLTAEQYEVLMEKQADFQCLINYHYIKNLPHAWLTKMQRIHQLFGGSLPNIRCGACVRTAMLALYKKIQEYEALQQSLQQATTTPAPAPVSTQSSLLTKETSFKNTLPQSKWKTKQDNKS